MSHQLTQIKMDEPLLPHQSGSAYSGNFINSTHPLTGLPDRSLTNYVRLSDWCRGNFISTDIGYTLIKKKLLVGVRRHHVWWVCANLTCLIELLDYLGIEQLYFDADNSLRVDDP